ncbi:hypothetical protein ACIPD2_18085 [Streptomyces griseofuscus]|uniref:hypothetical protein n=1 Tax=Streptomyces griseofuscus TaxID=146922 RepID=UPI0037F4DC87
MTVGHIGLFLLDWGKRQGNTAFDAMRWETEERMPRGAAQKVVDLRVETGHLTRAGSGLEVSLTELGEAEIVSARSRRRALKPRRDYTRTAFVRWLYKARPMQSVDFVKVPGSIYLGERLRPVEIGEAANYLGGKGLIDFTDWGVGQLFDPRLTAQGIDCAESGKTVSEFLTPPPAAPVFNVTVNGGTNVVGVNNTQNNGLSGTELVTLVAQLRALEPHVAEAQRQEYAQAVAVLDDSGQDSAQRATAWQRIKIALMQTGASVASAELLHLGDQVVQAITG